MTEESKWTTVFQVTVPEFQEPEKFGVGRRKFLDRLWREIEPIRGELGYQPGLPEVEKFVWGIENGERVRERMLQICSKLWLPDNDDFVNLLMEIFYDGIEASAMPQIDTVFSPHVRGATPLFFLSVAIPPDIDKLEPEEQTRFLTNGLFVEGMIPGLSEESFNQIFKRKGDYVIRGNLSLFNASAFREIGKWLEEIKNKIGGQHIFEIRPGRGHVAGKQNDETALRVYKIYLNVKNAHRGKKRKPRRHRSRYYSIYDEVGCNYEAKYGLGFRSISRDSIKYLIQKGKALYDAFEANQGRDNSA